MRSAVFLVPGSIETRTGGYEYDRRIVRGLRELGWRVDVRELDGNFPMPSGAALDGASRLLAAIPDDTLVVVDGLALGSMPAQVEAEARRLRIVAIVHLPLAQEIGLDPAIAARLEACERRALASVAAVVVTGAITVQTLIEYGVGRDRIAIVEPGTEHAPLARGAGAPFVHLVSVGALTPGKGHDVLVRALAEVSHRNWRLTGAGSIDRHPPTAERIRALVGAAGLDEHVLFAGDVDAAKLAALYDAADVFVLATLRETYGMAVAEALAHGLPVVATATGAIPDLVGHGVHAAGLVVPPGDVAALARALSQMLSDPRARQRFAEGARRVRERLPTWDDAARRISQVLDRI